MFADPHETPANHVESGTFSISITRGEHATVLASARELASVKLDAVEHAQRALRAGAAAAAELEHHRTELAEVQALVDQLHAAADSHHRRPRVTGRRALVDEIVHGALIAEGQELADGILALEPGDDLREITARLAVVRELLTTLAAVRL
jgi:hypothetical protein